MLKISILLFSGFFFGKVFSMIFFAASISLFNSISFWCWQKVLLIRIFNSFARIGFCRKETEFVSQNFIVLSSTKLPVTRIISKFGKSALASSTRRSPESEASIFMSVISSVMSLVFMISNASCAVKAEITS